MNASSGTDRVYDSILGLLPGVENPTPMVRLNQVTPFEHTEVYAKLEWYNPFGSVKDRIAASLLEDGLTSGTVVGGTRLVEPTSGNTGMALAMLAGIEGIGLTTPVSSAIPIEKRTALAMFGARVEELSDDLCPAPGAPEGAIARATELAAEPGHHMLNQYVNEANPEAHYRTTGPEIWRQTDGTVTHFVAGLGTCGTITGTSRFLKERNPKVHVLGVHPAEGHDIPGVRSLRQLEQTRFFEPETYDGLIEIDNRAAYELCLRLNREESIPAGPSSGLALAGAFRAIPDVEGARVVVIFPDSAFKYTSSMPRHVDGLTVGELRSAATGRERLLDAMIENARHNPDLTVDVAAAKGLVDEGAMVIDVRLPSEFNDGHVPGASNFPLLELPGLAGLLPADRDAPILSVCRRGNLSLTGVLYLQSLGYKAARSVNGGTDEWGSSGLPLERNSSTPDAAHRVAPR